jgi:hypothetical protein
MVESSDAMGCATLPLMKTMRINWKFAVLAAVVGLLAFVSYLYVGIELMGRRLETMDFSAAMNSRTIQGIQIELKVISWLVRSGLISRRETDGSSVGSVFAQNAARPILTGTWKLNLAKSKLDKHHTIRSETLTISSADTTIQFHYTTDGRESVRTYIADGKERAAAEVKDGQRFATATWRNSVLVIEEIERLKRPGYTPDESERFHVTDRWTLTGNGNSLTRDSNSPEKHQVFVYDKE